MMPYTRTVLVATLLATLLAGARASDTPFCAAQRAACTAACRAPNADFRCHDKHGAREVSCSCSTTAAHFGHAQMVKEASNPAPSSATWWKTWLGGALPPAALPASPAGLVDPLVPSGDDSPWTAVALAFGAAALAATVAAAALAAALAAAWLAQRASAAWPHLSSRRTRTKGAAYKAAPPAAAPGLDLEVGQAGPDAPVLLHGKGVE